MCFGARTDTQSRGLQNPQPAIPQSLPMTAMFQTGALSIHSQTASEKSLFAAPTPFPETRARKKRTAKALALPVRVLETCKKASQAIPKLPTGFHIPCFLLLIRRDPQTAHKPPTHKPPNAIPFGKDAWVCTVLQ